MKSKLHIVSFLLLDMLLLILAGFNLKLFLNKPGLPDEYEAVINDFSFDMSNIYKKEEINEFDGKKIFRSGLVDFYLLSHRFNDKVNIKSTDAKGKMIERTVSLPLKYVTSELLIIAAVTLFFFFTGIFILLKYKDTSFAYIIHTLSISAGLMIIFDWGDTVTYNCIFNFLIFLFFDISIYLLPTLFLHLSFIYPVKTGNSNLHFLVPFYCAAFTFILISLIQLIKIFFFGSDVSKSYYLDFHTTIADVYLAIVIILTIARFEFSALTVNDITHKKQIYWVLSGITFGPLIYVFLCLIPRLLLGHELISIAFMQFTTIIAPVMLLISVTRYHISPSLK
jgi:hypothetical protein